MGWMRLRRYGVDEGPNGKVWSEYTQENTTQTGIRSQAKKQRVKKSSNKRWQQAALEERLAPIFERFLDLVQELMGDGAVDHAVVVAQRHVAHRADGDGIVDDHGPLLDGADAENADVGLADDRQAEETAENAGIGDGESAFLNFFRLEFFGAGSLGKIVQVALDAEDVFLVSVFDDRNDQTPVECDGNANVDFFVEDDIRAVEGGVHGGEGAQAGHGGFNEGGHEGQLGLVARLEFILGLGA